MSDETAGPARSKSGALGDLCILAFDAVGEPLLLSDTSFRVVAANRAARQLSPALAAGQAVRCSQLIYGRAGPCADPDLQCPLRRAAREGRTTTVRHEHPGPLGQVNIVEVTATPLHDRDGRLAGILQIIRDITEKAKTEEIVGRARDEWVATADSVPDLILLTDLERRIIRCNRAAARFLGASYQDLIGKGLREAFRSVSEDVGVLDEERGELRSDRPRATLEVASYAAQVEGRPYGTVWVMRDVTAVRRLETIAASVDMMNNLGHVLGTVRHELGNPINAIKTALSVLRERFGSFPEEKKRDYLERCLDDVARVQALLENLRTFNMFEAVRCERMDLMGLLVSLAGWLEDHLRTQRIAFELHLPPAERKIVVSADRRALQQVILGLISNAADAVAARRKPRIDLEVEEEGDEIRIAVVDNGGGIAPDELPMVFLPLFTTKPQGTGLGLAIARNLVVRMNGTIDLRSRLGRGTRVEILLPRVEGQVSTPSPGSGTTHG